MINPALFIVAGPNGAGKSLFSKKLTDSAFEVFDGDKHMVTLMKVSWNGGSEALLSYIDENIFAKENRKHWLPEDYPAWVKPVVAQFQDHTFLDN